MVSGRDGTRRIYRLSGTGRRGEGPRASRRDEEDAMDATNTIEFQGIAYKPTGPNSNTVAKTLLSALGIPPRKPGVLAPGWDDPPLAR